MSKDKRKITFDKVGTPTEHEQAITAVVKYLLKAEYQEVKESRYKTDEEVRDNDRSDLSSSID